MITPLRKTTQILRLCQQRGRTAHDYFREAKKRRQIIIVTHNPNLVVNTDDEEIIVATAERRESGYPVISYTAGPLELVQQASPVPVKQQVCDILEGGRDAFRRRDVRYA